LGEKHVMSFLCTRKKGDKSFDTQKKKVKKKKKASQKGGWPV